MLSWLKIAKSGKRFGVAELKPDANSLLCYWNPTHPLNGDDSATKLVSPTGKVVKF